VNKTVLEVIRATTEYLERTGIESPRLNAEHLVAHALGKKRLDLYLEFDRPLGEQELAPLREAVRARGQGVPLQHLLGTTEFCGRVFLADRRALIPRPETEQLVELVLAEAPAAPGGGDRPVRILDVGTGTGVIALSIASEFPLAEVHAVDISDDALALARSNAEKLGLASRVRFSQSDLLESVEGFFDVIVANLPYIPTAILPKLAREVGHDPALALNGGPDGLALIARLAREARSRLCPGGFLALEIGHDQADRLVDKLAGEGYQGVRSAADYQGVQRFIIARYG
jgi:release factor glutamine methyltransferase